MVFFRRVKRHGYVYVCHPKGRYQRPLLVNGILMIRHGQVYNHLETGICNPAKLLGRRLARGANSTIKVHVIPYLL